MNRVLFSYILELSETKPKFYKLRRLVTNWRGVCYLSIGVLTLKVIAEQLVMLIRS